MKRVSVFVTLMVVGCGGGAKTAVEKCDDLTNSICDRAVSCIPSQAGSHSDCVQTVQQVLPCGQAKSVSASYDRCLSQVESDSCPILFPVDPQSGQPALDLPADCSAVIVVNRFTPEAGFAGGDATATFERASRAASGWR